MNEEGVKKNHAIEESHFDNQPTDTAVAVSSSFIDDEEQTEHEAERTFGESIVGINEILDRSER